MKFSVLHRKRDDKHHGHGHMVRVVFSRYSDGNISDKRRYKASHNAGDAVVDGSSDRIVLRHDIV